MTLKTTGKLLMASAVGMLALSTIAFAQQPGGGFALAGLSSYCREVLEITHLDKLWKLHANEDDAVASLA